MTVFLFDRCELDVDTVELRIGGEPRAVEPQVFEVLAFLVRHRDRLVPKEELLDAIWQHRFVTDSALSSRIKSARAAIGDDGRAQRLIRTVHGRGYQFVGDVRVRDAGAADAATAAPEAPAAARPTPVPRPATPTIGRDRAIAEVLDLLARQRIVTLLGPGGVGKTRLAAEVVLHGGPGAPADTGFVDLTLVRDAEHVPDLIVRELGIRAGDGSNARQVLSEALRGRNFLLVLDNFEHVIDAAGIVTDIVQASPGVVVLATSRARLRIAGEHVVDVAPLPVDPVGGDGRGELADAVALFAQAATAVDGTFRLQPNLADVVSICRMVDGLPLAIELAAGHVRTLPPSLLRTRLGARLGSPTGAARDAPARQQTVPATIDWSLQLLGAPERRLFARLGIFAGPVPLDAVEQVCADPRADVVEALSRLVDQSLVRRLVGGRGEVRFALLELVRDRARELQADQDEAAVARRHAAYAAAYVGDLEERRWGDAAGTWVDAVTELLAEIRAAHAWACAAGEADLAARITAALGNFWHREGQQAEGRRWVADALATRDVLDAELVARLHLAAGFVEWPHSTPVARHHWEAALVAFRRLGHQRYLAYAMTLVSATYLGDHARFEEALALCEESIGAARRLGCAPLLASTLNVKGELARVEGDDAAAFAAYEEGRELAIAIGDDQHLSMFLGCLSFLADHAGRYDEARRLACNALLLCWSVGRRVTAADTICHLAGPELGLGRPERAARLIGAADGALQALGGARAPGDRPEYDRVVARLRRVLGDDELARLRAEGAALSLDEAVDLALS